MSCHVLQDTRLLQPAHFQVTDISFIRSGVDGHYFRIGPPMSTSYPNGDPFTDVSAHYIYTPRSTATDGVAAANEDSTSTSTYSSAVTFVDPNLSIQTVTITSLPVSQSPTSISTNQTFGVTTGVSNL
jgi:hypothetical protein